MTKVLSTHITLRDYPMIVHVLGSRLDLLRTLASAWDEGEFGVDITVLVRVKKVYHPTALYIPFHMLTMVEAEHEVEYDETPYAPTHDHETVEVSSPVPGLEVVL